MTSIQFQGKPFGITVIQVYAPSANAKGAEVLWWPTRPSRTNTKNRCPFHHRGLEWKSRKSRDIWSNRQVGLRVKNEARQSLTEFYQENTLVIARTLFQQRKRRLYTWTSGGQYQNQNDYILCSWRWRISTQQQKQDWELTVTYCKILTQLEESRENH